MANPNTAARYVRKLVPVAAMTFRLGNGNYADLVAYVQAQKDAGYRVKITKRYNGKNFQTKQKSYVNVVYSYEKAK
jgi:hypothetical protein